MMMIGQHLGTSSLEHLFCEEEITTISLAKSKHRFHLLHLLLDIFGYFDCWTI